MTDLLDAATVDAATSEFESVRVPEDRRFEIAYRLGVDKCELDRHTELHGIAEAAIQDALVERFDGDDEEFDRLIRLRAYVETIVALEIELEGDKQRLLETLDEKQRQLIQLSKSEYLASKTNCPLRIIDSRNAWKYDGAFHRSVFEIAGYGNLAEVVDIAMKECRSTGRPRTLSDLNDTIQEHKAIIDALVAEEVEDARLCDANLLHVFQGWKRWCAEEGDMRDFQIEPLLDRVEADMRDDFQSSGFGEPSDDAIDSVLQAIYNACSSQKRLIAMAACDDIRQSISRQFIYPEQYVVLKEVESYVEGECRIRNEVLCTSSRLRDVEQFVESLPFEEGLDAQIDFQPDPGIL